MPKFQPGQSGNPKGKPPGAKDKRSELREMLRPHANALIEKAVEMAMGGDITALRLCLDKLIPNLRPVTEPAPLSLRGDTLLEKGQAILMAVSEGRITPEEGNHRLAMLAHYGRLVGPERSLERYADDKQFNEAIGRL
jgi:hypothetical protein